MASKQQPEADLAANPSSPAPTIGETTLSGLPVLTEVIDKADTYLPRLLTEDEIQQLLPRIEAHIEALFTKKLGLQLEQLQRQAIEQAIRELKAELPELLHDALYSYLDSSE
ncbi:MAG TPA: hypothetical protein VMJ33_11145 [Gallionella sp.]|nr:hypothetical protein [Gallionella sp.]